MCWNMREEGDGGLVIACAPFFEIAETVIEGEDQEREQHSSFRVMGGNAQSKLPIRK